MKCLQIFLKNSRSFLGVGGKNNFQGVLQSPEEKNYNSRSLPGIRGPARTVVSAVNFSVVIKYLELSHSGRLTLPLSPTLSKERDRRISLAI